MKNLLLFFSMLLLPAVLFGQANLEFKMLQQNHEKVKAAYVDKENDLKKLVVDKGIKSFSNHMLIRIFKNEALAEVWVKPQSAKAYTLLKRYKLCDKSGEFGPKKLTGDKQIPEGFYYVSSFEPEGNEELALTINYPNVADQKRKAQKDMVFLWGACKAAGNVALGPEAIKEIYVLAVEAKASGQEQIPVHIFPAVLTPENLNKLASFYAGQQPIINFWASLKSGHDYFNKMHILPEFTTDEQGNYQFTDANGKALPTTPVAAAPIVATRGGNNAPAKPSAVASTPTAGTHVVAPSETLYSISKKYQMKVDDLKRLNSLKNNNITVGQTLKVTTTVTTAAAAPVTASAAAKPKPATAVPATTTLPAAPATNAAYYVVQKGDTFFSIAKKHQLTLDQLLALNGKDKKKLSLLVGEKLKVGK